MQYVTGRLRCLVYDDETPRGIAPMSDAQVIDAFYGWRRSGHHCWDGVIGRVECIALVGAAVTADEKAPAETGA